MSKKRGMFGDALGAVYGDGQTAQAVLLDSLRGDVGGIRGELQVRVGGLDMAVVGQYAAILENGGELPPVVVFAIEEEDDALYLAAGFHRVAAHEAAGLIEVQAIIKAGTWDEARQFAEDDNLRNGKMLATGDKKVIVMARFNRGHEWLEWTDGRVAGVIGVDRKTIGNWRAAWEQATGENSPVRRLGADGRWVDVGGIQEHNKRPAARFQAGDWVQFVGGPSDVTVQVETVEWVDVEWRYVINDKMYLEGDLVATQFAGANPPSIPPRIRRGKTDGMTRIWCPRRSLPRVIVLWLLVPCTR